MDEYVSLLNLIHSIPIKILKNQIGIFVLPKSFSCRQFQIRPSQNLRKYIRFFFNANKKYEFISNNTIS